MEFSQEYIGRKLEQERKELSSGKMLLRAAISVVVVTSLLVSFNLWRGWRTLDFFYVFLLVVWLAFFFIQRKIMKRKQEQVDRLAEELQRA